MKISRVIFLVVAWIWSRAILAKRFVSPRPFKAVLVRRRCPGCGRRLRKAIADTVYCRRCRRAVLLGVK